MITPGIKVGSKKCDVIRWKLYDKLAAMGRAGQMLEFVSDIEKILMGTQYKLF